jgi:hypothetical protein
MELIFRLQLCRARVCSASSTKTRFAFEGGYKMKNSTWVVYF